MPNVHDAKNGVSRESKALKYATAFSSFLIEAIRPGHEHVIDEVLEFRAVDIIADKCGYVTGD